MRLNLVGLILDMVAVVILGFEPMRTLWGTGIAPAYPWLHWLGWGMLFVGFACQFIYELRRE